MTKVVVGDAPADATFTMGIDCTATLNPAGSVDPSTVDPSAIVRTKSFQPALKNGEKFSVFDVGGGTCTITETDSQGAESVVVSSPTVTAANFYLYPVTVTNTFPVTPPKFTG